MACLIKIIIGSRNYKAQAPKELKSYAHANTCTWMFVAALFIIVETWKQAGRGLDTQTVAHPDNGMLFQDAKK